MNLALEYFVRSGTARDAIEIPCSLCLNHTQNNKHGLVVTIHKHPDSEKYLIRHWYLHRAKGQAILPPFSEFDVESRDELFVSPHVVVPMYALLEFQEKPYKTGTKQSSRGHRALTQQLEYKEIMESFFNTSASRRLRKRWLWTHFLQSHDITIPASFIRHHIDDQMLKVRTQYMQSWAKWELWNKQMRFDTEVATELIFHQAYGTKLHGVRKATVSSPSHRPRHAAWPLNPYTDMQQPGWEASHRLDSSGIWYGSGI